MVRVWLCVVLGFLGLRTLAAPTVPFVLPWDDASPGVTDLSAWNRPIHEGLRVAADARGHFVAGGERVRFLGMNFAGDSPFAPTNKADAMAARLSKFGFNCVRFHHIDAPWATGGGVIRYTPTSSRALQPAQLERIHYMVWRLREHGIYSDINLLTGREFRSGDGLGSAVVGMDPKDQHILAMFHDPALELQKEFATQLLAGTNRFTGVPLARDPSVAFVEVLNENGLFQKWYDGGLDRLPSTFADALRGRWNAWLRGRYADDAALAAAWKAQEIPLGTNLLRNGAFGSGVTSWVLEQHQGAVAAVTRTTDFNGAAAARIAVTRTGAESWHVQFNQPGLRVTGSRLYTLTFSARADADANLDLAVMMAHDPWQAVGLAESVRLTPTWQTFTRTFVVSATDANVRVNFGGMGTRLGNVWLADVRLQEGGRLGLLPDGTSLAAGTVPSLRYGGDGFKGTDDARRDWLRFLETAENAYYDAMRVHLRDRVGYPGLVFGTIMANSPAAVQGRLDAIDSHAYWQHPVFPGTPWDPVNWTVGNRSMLSVAAGETTLAALARQRLRGRPHLVTEYQHPSPNTYAAEGPLLLAAYAALQDWDGIWLFDYGWGNDAAQGTETRPMGRIRGFFDTGQHPAKMANVQLAARMFRGGDVQPAREEVSLGLRPSEELEWLLKRAGAWNVFSSSHAGMPGALALVHRVSIDYAESPSAPAVAPAAPATTLSDTGELHWQGAATGGWMSVNTPRTRAVLGEVGLRETVLGDVRIRLLAGSPAWATVGLTLTSGGSFAGGGRALLVATAGVENTGQVWKSTAQDSLTAWGTAPVLVEPVPVEVRLPVVAARVKAWALDARGQRRAEALVAVAPDGTALVTTRAVDATLWWEIEIAAPDTVSFEAWRQAEFTPGELADLSVSGPSASPAGDGVPNLVKYALGLPARTPASREDLPQWGLTTGIAGRDLWLSYTRRKGASGVRLSALQAEALGAWAPATERVVQDLGERERVRTELRVVEGAPALGFLQLIARQDP